MMNNLTISQVAEKTGLTPKTIRYYESRGVIQPLARQDNAYRTFSERDVERLELVKRARSLGLPLSEVKSIVSQCIDKGCLEARQYVAAQVPSYLKKVERNIAELQQLKSQLEYLQDDYRTNGAAWQHRSVDCCQIIPIKEENRLDLHKIPADPKPPAESRTPFSAVTIPTGMPPSEKRTSESLLDGSGSGEVLGKPSI